MASAGHYAGETSLAKATGESGVTIIDMRAWLKFSCTRAKEQPVLALAQDAHPRIDRATAWRAGLDYVKLLADHAA
jgi:hypothetical protein